MVSFGYQKVGENSDKREGIVWFDHLTTVLQPSTVRTTSPVGLVLVLNSCEHCKPGRYHVGSSVSTVSPENIVFVHTKVHINGPVDLVFTVKHTLSAQSYIVLVDRKKIRQWVKFLRLA